MRTALFRLSLALFFALPLLLPAQAQETTGQLEGRVLDAQGEPLEGAHVVVVSPSLQGARWTPTTPQGVFLLVALPVGEYEVTLSHVAHKTQIIAGVRIRLGHTTSLRTVQLPEKLYEVEGATVTARAPLIDPRSTVVGASLRVEEYAALPVERDYQSMALLLSHANESFIGDPMNIAGATGQENRYFIDGMDVTEPVLNGGGTRLPHNFVREMRVRTGGYEAEYRASLGGIVDAVTHSGGNEFHGQAFGYYVNNRFTAEPRRATLEPNTGDFARYDFGLSLGGPLKKDKLWYYLAYDPAYEREDYDVPGCGFYEDRSTAHSFAGKLTWSASDQHTFIATVVGDPTERRGVGELYAPGTTPTELENPDPYLMDFRTGGVNVRLGGRHLIRPNVLLNSSLSWGRHDDERIPSTARGREEMLYADEETGIWSGGSSDYFDEHSTVTHAGLSCSWLTGDHHLKTGVEFKDVNWHINQHVLMLSRFADDSYQLITGDSEADVGTRVLSTFLQDSWRVSDRLRINAGLRWDGQYMVATDNKVAQSILDAWQPRVGLLFQPDDAGRHQFSASVGRYYQELAANVLIYHYNDKGTWYFIDYDHDPRDNGAGGDTLAWPYMIRPEFDLEGQHFDEATLGYERRLGASSKLSVRGVYRTLRQTVEDGYHSETFEGEFGNPGSGRMSDFPKAKREYTALELGLRHQRGERLTLMASYILSRSYGNYPGLFQEWGWEGVNAGLYFDFVETLVDAEGLLPNDRPHVLKMAGSYQLATGLTMGIVGTWASGTPKNDFGSHWAGYPFFIFLQPRGTAGRTPDIWDLDARLTYVLPISESSRWQPKLALDILNIASQRTPVLYDYMHYFAVDEEGGQASENPNYGLATRYQPPMAVRFGVEVDF